MKTINRPFPHSEMFFPWIVFSEELMVTFLKDFSNCASRKIEKPAVGLERRGSGWN